MSLIVPYLGRCNWKGKDILFHRDLLKTNHLHRAVVCYGYKDESGRYQYLTAMEAAQSGLTHEQVEYEAMHNLLYRDQDEPDWVPIVTRVGEQKVTILTREGSSAISSSILRSELLRDLQHYFESSVVAVAVPSRNVMLACDRPELMLDYLKRRYQESVSKGYEPVSDMVYLAKGGVLIGAAPFPGTENLIEKAAEDSHTVSLKKPKGSSSSSKSMSSKKSKAQGRPKTQMKIDLGETPRKKKKKLTIRR